MSVDLPADVHIISICSGIGGLDLGVGLAAECLGVRVRVVCYVEIEAYAAALLAKRMEEGHLDPAPIWTDVATFPGVAGQFRGAVDGVIAGYPCQPFSAAGKRGGVSDPRHLFPYIRRVVRTVEPVFCFFENVRGHLSLGFDAVQRCLQRDGYAVECGIFSAAEVGASHRRERLFVLAHRGSRGGWERSEGCGDVADAFRASGERWREPGDVAGAAGQELDEACQWKRDGDTVDDSGGTVADAERAKWRQEVGAGMGGDAGVHAAREGAGGTGECGGVLEHAAGARCGEGRSSAGKSVWDRAWGKESDGRCGAVGHAEDDNGRRGIGSQKAGVGTDGVGRRGFTGAGDDVAHAGEPGCEGRQFRTTSGNRGGAEASRPVAELRYAHLPAFPPGPSDHEAWRAIIARWPELAPATDDSLRVRAHVYGRTGHELPGMRDGAVGVSHVPAGEGRDVADGDSVERSPDEREAVAGTDGRYDAGGAGGDGRLANDGHPGTSTLQKETERELCGLDDELSAGMEFRTDRLRAGGNAVVALQAAYAFSILAEKAGIIKTVDSQ